MKAEGIPRRTIAVTAGGEVEIIDQTELPARLVLRTLRTLDDVAEAIVTMRVRGAPLIGVAAAYGLALGLREDASDDAVARHSEKLRATRPTAVNLAWALDEVRREMLPLSVPQRAEAAWRMAARLAEDDVATCRAIAGHGATLLGQRADSSRPRALQVMTHCNAGWLATVDWGTALAPVYALHDAGVPVHVWVSETRPRNQGLLTEWELAQHGVPHTLIVDNAAGHLLHRGEVDAVIVGTDRTTRCGDVVNKIGTYLKALAAHDAGVPFYVAAPSSSIDFSIQSGGDVEIEHRSGGEVAADKPVLNPGFDVTPARLVSCIITERGVSAASEEGLGALFPERAHDAPRPTPHAPRPG